MTPAEVSKQAGNAGRVWLLVSTRRRGHVSAWTAEEKCPGPDWVRSFSSAREVARMVDETQATPEYADSIDAEEPECFRRVAHITRDIYCGTHGREAGWPCKGRAS